MKIVNFLKFTLDSLFAFRDPRRVGGIDVQRGRPLCKNVCLFAHFESDNQVKPATLHYLAALSECGFSIVFITTMASLSSEDLKCLMETCAVVMRRPNVGLDFGSWKTAIHLMPEIFNCDELILCNDSVWGPFFSLSSILQKMREGSSDLSGFTDSFERRYHLQSYFLFLKKSVIRSSFFVMFWKQLLFLKNKDHIIRRYELGFTQKVMAAGFQVEALFPIEKISAEIETRNPVQYFWRELIEKFDFPFIKKELIIKNPTARLGLDQLGSILAKKNSPYPLSFINEILSQVKK